MKALNKNITKSTQFDTWQKGLTTGFHPKYTSSSHELYYDIVMELFHIQGGLCAYTEVILCDPQFYDSANWVNGKYTCTVPSGHTIPEFIGDLDHFDPSLKKTDGWDWNNFFMIHSNINRKKSTKTVTTLLKPDLITYNATNLLSYEPRKNLFTPNFNNTAITSAQYQDIQDAIDVLGINHSTIKHQRKLILRKKQAEVESGSSTWKAGIEQFPTAHAMMELLYNAGTLPTITSY